MSCPLSLWITLLATLIFPLFSCYEVCLIQVLFRSDDYWIINKPAGMSFHSENDETGVIKKLALEYPEVTFFPVHRLDKMTSGLLIVACHKKAAAEFGHIFEKHLIEKRYVALSQRKPKKKQSTISGGMAPSRRGQWKLTPVKENVAITQFFSFAYNGLRVFFVRPLTGKTHQIRVALKSVGSPILGDTRYGGDVASRGYLHAYSLSFEWCGEAKRYICPFPIDTVFTLECVAGIEKQFDESLLTWPSNK